MTETMRSLCPPRHLLGAFFLAALLGLAAVSSAQAPADRKTFESWLGESLRIENGNVFAISRTRDNGRANVELQMVKRVGDCSNTTMSVYLADPSPEKRRVGKQPVQGKLQVDSLAAHTIEADFYAEPGTNYRVFWVRVYDAPRAVMQELASGQSVRLSFTLDQREQTFQFSLRGYGPAYEYIKQLCAAPPPPGQASKPKAPASGGQSAPKAKPKGDADFFPGPSGGASPSKGSKSDKDYF